MIEIDRIYNAYGYFILTLGRAKTIFGMDIWQCIGFDIKDEEVWMTLKPENCISDSEMQSFEQVVPSSDETYCIVDMLFSRNITIQ